jgi:biopolymer transport protein ExbB
MTAPVLLAQAAAAEPAESLLFWYMRACGPFFAAVFILISVIFVTLTIMNWLAVSRNAVAPPEMISEFNAKLEAKDYQGGYETAVAGDSVLGRIFAAGLLNLSSGSDAVRQAMNETAEDEIMRMEHRLGYLGTIASVAPMVGLLGTVWGMVNAFSVIARSGAAPQASELANGISLALVTTQIGLLIAIPAFVFFEIFKNRLARLIFELNGHIDNVIRQIPRQRHG